MIFIDDTGEDTWRDVSGQTLTPDSRTRVLGEATTFGDEWLEHEARKKREHKIALFHIKPVCVYLFLFIQWV